ncbi:hypothetical protein AND_000895 [Anopheles darlingi]|uniref:Uncharacterized protein n=1 Tax=Anopheles darlingi TaxID=43151 RepID=W5JWD2_ANODA|nr:hypothetical protein AND_000895 [Anopheles darlingi]
MERPEEVVEEAVEESDLADAKVGELSVVAARSGLFVFSDQSERTCSEQHRASAAASLSSSTTGVV